MNNNSIFKYFNIAAETALSKSDGRTFFLGAVGIRRDGVLVKALNGPSKIPTREAHAEHRISKKLSTGSTVFVARMRRDGNFGLAKPCANCLLALKRKKTKVIYYTISNNEYGVIVL